MIKTGIKGVTRIDDNLNNYKYYASIDLPTGSRFLGSFDDIKEAARVLYRAEIDEDKKRKRIIY